MNRMFLLIAYLAIFSCAYAQDKILAPLYNALENRNWEFVAKETQRLESVGIETYNDSIKSDFYYVLGTYYDCKGESDSCSFYYDQCIKFAELSDLYETTYFASVLIRMSMLFQAEDYVACANLGKRASRHLKELRLFPKWTDIFFYWSLSLENLYRVDESIHILQSICEEFRNNPDKYYYFKLRIVENYLLKGDFKSADSLYADISNALVKECSIGTSTTTFFHKIEKTMQKAHGEHGDLKKWASELMTKCFSSLIYKSAGPICEDLAYYREQLFSHYFNKDSKEDSYFWNRAIAYLKVSAYLATVDADFKPSELYENALTYKNFLDWHFGSTYRPYFSTKDVHQALAKHEAAIEMNFLPEEFLLLRYDSIEPIRIPIDSTIFGYLYYYNYDSPYNINQLYSKDSPLSRLWETIEGHLQDIQTLYISPIHFYTRINWGAIQRSDGKSRVCDKYNIRNVISSSVICENKDSDCVSFRDAALYGGVLYNTSESEMKRQASSYDLRASDAWTLTRDMPEQERGILFSFLPGTLEEVDKISSMLEKKRILFNVRTGSKANEESFKSMDGCSPSIIHIASHGFSLRKQATENYKSKKIFEKDTISYSFYSNSMSRAGIALSGANRAWMGKEAISGVEDGILTAYEISQLDLSNTKLAVLSACESGLGDFEEVSGLALGLVHAFRMAGVDKMVVSLWKISDDVTSMLMESFYSHLLKGESVYDALANAKRHLQENGYIDPYYWASFVIVE